MKTTQWSPSRTARPRRARTYWCVRAHTSSLRDICAGVPTLSSVRGSKPAALVKRSRARHAAAHMQAVGRTLLEQYAPGAPQQFGYHLPPFNSVDHLHLHCFALPFTPPWKSVKYTAAGLGSLWYLPSSTLLEVRCVCLDLLRWRPYAEAFASALGCRSGRCSRLRLNGRHALMPARLLLCALSLAGVTPQWTARPDAGTSVLSSLHSPFSELSVAAALTLYRPLMCFKRMLSKNVLICGAARSRAGRA